MTDLRIALDVFLVLAFTEVIAKPIAIKLGQAALQWADEHVGWVPDWLYKGPKS
jgi:hypothetical protein